jgi:hypothetical protein
MSYEMFKKLVREATSELLVVLKIVFLQMPVSVPLAVIG